MQLPKDFRYFRSSSEGYKKYLQKCGLNIIELKDETFGWFKKFFFNSINLAKFERTDLEPDFETLKENGFKRGFVIWVPINQEIIPSKGWKKVLIPTHFMKTGYTNIQENYKINWNQRARRSLKKFEKSNCIIKKVDNDFFNNSFKKAKTKIPSKRGFLDYHKSLSILDGDNIHNYLVYKNDEIIAGLAVYDFDKYSSVHIVSFHTKKAKEIQASTGLIDIWFLDSYKKGLKYINFDHLKDENMTSSQNGYTNFKLNFIENILDFKKSYFKFYI